MLCYRVATPIFFSKRRIGSPEKKAPLVLSNFAHLILAATKPNTRTISQQHVQIYTPISFEVFSPGEYVQLQAIARSSIQASPPCPLESHCPPTRAGAAKTLSPAPRCRPFSAKMNLKWLSLSAQYRNPVGDAVASGEAWLRGLSTRNATNGRRWAGLRSERNKWSPITFSTNLQIYSCIGNRSCLLQ